MLPKNLLRFRHSLSPLKEFTTGSKEYENFRTVIGETATNSLPNDKIRRVILCSGKVYYDVWEKRQQESSLKHIAIIRIEQLAPFPFDLVAQEVSKYPNAEVVWLQEEPKNMGCWNWIVPHLRTALKATRGADWMPLYVGRPASASPATGSENESKAQRAAFVADALHSD
jgi:2-oxoglutarate dehydrogenase E1 component